MTILLVDDDEDDRDIFRDATAIAKPDSHLIFATNGEDALDLLGSLSTPPDIIFLDVNMPKMDGKELLKAIKANPAFKDIPVVMYSTSSQRGELGEYFGIGAAHYITKPSEFNLLVTYLKTVLQDNKSNTQLPD